jgi:hypothetical protein
MSLLLPLLYASTDLLIKWWKDSQKKNQMVERPTLFMAGWAQGVKRD